jgi:oxygen-dependent protoporphyrinogen oxidase
VIVVGAGVAGLSAAFRLVQQGHRVTVLERAACVGGRAAAGGSDTDPIAARVSTADHALHALVRDAGLAHEFLPVRPVRSAFELGGHFVPIPPGGDPRAVARTPGVRFLDALRLVRLPRLLARYRANLDPGAPERAAAHDDRSLADFGTLYFGRSVVTAWMEPWLAERAPVDEREASRAAFLMRFAAEREAVAGSLAAPIGRLAAALAARLEVRTGAGVRRVEAGVGGGLRVVLDAETLDADAVVLAVPAPEAHASATPCWLRPSGRCSRACATTRRSPGGAAARGGIAAADACTHREARHQPVRFGRARGRRRHGGRA